MGRQNKQRYDSLNVRGQALPKEQVGESLRARWHVGLRRAELILSSRSLAHFAAEGCGSHTLIYAAINCGEYRLL
jgi:hypothetical protein